MILTQENRSIETFGEIKKQKFTIKQNRKSFRVLVGTLYSDKVGAAIREISANSFDSHIRAGKKDIPFDVYLPSQFEPTFIVRDRGVSMTHEFMMERYSCAFDSTKDNNNEEVGALGLGRLVLLSLSDSYIATCFLDGEKRVYSVFIDEDGEPCIAPLTKEPTDEENGFMVEVAVDPNLANSFDEKAQDIYQFYKIKPNIKNRDDFQVIENKYIILDETGDFGLRGNGFDSIGIMGCYSYPIDANSIPGLDDIHRKILESGLMVHFNIGEIDVSANRQSLHYNKTTIESIKNKLNLIVEKIKPVILSHFINQNGLGKLALYNDLFDDSGKLHAISSLAREFLKDLKIENSLNFDNFEVETYSWDNWKSKIKKSISKSFYFSKDMIFVYCDKKSHKRRRAKKFFDDINNRNKKLVFIEDAGVDDSFELFKKQYEIDIQNDFVKSSTLPFDAPVSNDGSGKKFKTLVYICGYYSTPLKNRWAEQELDPNDNIIYVLRTGYYINGNISSSEVKNLKDNIVKLRNLTGEQNIQVYGLTARELKHKKSHWREFYSYLKEESNNWVKKQEEKIAVWNYKKENYSDFPDERLKKIKINKNTLCADILKEYKEITAELQNFDPNNVYETKDFSKIKTNKYKYTTSILKEKYPLLFAISDTYYTPKGTWKDLEKYVNEKETKIDVDNSEDKE